MNTDLLLLADSRLPAGGHAHSGGVEPAAAAGIVEDLAGLADFLRGRLATSGLVAAALAASACTLATDRAPSSGTASPQAGAALSSARVRKLTYEPTAAAEWVRLDGEADARTPSPAQRAASRAQGRSMLRAVRTAWPSPVLDELRAAIPGGPHQPLVVGAATAVMRGSPGDAAAITAYDPDRSTWSEVR